MNKWQKEVQQASLNSEKEVLKKIKENYEEAIDRIDANIAQLLVREDADMQHVIYQIEYQKALKKQNEAILLQLQENNFQTVSEYLSTCYENGFIGAMYDIQGQGIPLIIPIDQAQVVQAVKTQSKLSTSLYDAFDIKDLQKQISAEISRGISSEMIYGEIAQNIARRSGISQRNAIRIVRTEGHRIQCTAQLQACEKAKSKGADVVKQWDSTLDGKTRDSHRRLDGQIREIDELFEIDGMTAMHPSDFGDPAEDINCRCVCNQRAKWALDEDELATLEERAEYWDLDKSEDFADYKSKYLKATESERVRSNARKIKGQDDFDDRSGMKKKFRTFADNLTRNRPPKSLNNINGDGVSHLKRTIANSKRKSIIEKNAEKIQFAKTNAQGSKRSTKNGIFVDLVEDRKNPKGAMTTTFHEIGHKLDQIYGRPSSHGEFGDALRKDFQVFTTNYCKTYNISEQQMYEELTRSFESTDIRQIHIIKDLFGGLTNNAIRGGHDTSYWKTENALEREAFAHFFSADALGYDDKIETVKIIFPKAYDEYIKIIGSMT